MSSNVVDRFYVTAWVPKDDGETCALMEREGADDGGNTIVAEFSRYPAPLGEQLAVAALKSASVFAEKDQDEAYGYRRPGNRSSRRPWRPRSSSP